MQSTNRYKIILFNARSYEKKFFDLANQTHHYQITYVQSRLDASTVHLSEGFDVVCAAVHDVIDKVVITQLHHYKIKLIAMRCAGYNNVDFKEVYKKKIRVMRVPAYSPFAIAEHTISLMLALNRHLNKACFRIRQFNFSIEGLVGFDMYKKTAGIIGTGKIGLAVISILNGFGMEVLAFDKFRNEDKAKEMNFKYVSLDELYQNSDIITLHCPLNEDTYHLINETSIAKMKSGIMLINTGRGALIDTRALVNGLKSKKIGFAGLDVYEEEDKYFFKDWSHSVIDDDLLARLITFPNVIVTGHQAFLTKEALKEIAEVTLGNIAAFFQRQCDQATSPKKCFINEVCYRCEAQPCKKLQNEPCF